MSVHITIEWAFQCRKHWIILSVDMGCSVPLLIIAKHFKSRLGTTFLTLQLLVLAKFKLNLKSVATGSKKPRGSQLGETEQKVNYAHQSSHSHTLHTCSKCTFIDIHKANSQCRGGVAFQHMRTGTTSWKISTRRKKFATIHCNPI